MFFYVNLAKSVKRTGPHSQFYQPHGVFLTCTHMHMSRRSFCRALAAFLLFHLVQKSRESCCFVLAHILLIINSPSGQVFYLLIAYLETLGLRKPILEACNYTNLNKSPNTPFYLNLLKRGVFIFMLLLDFFFTS